MAVPLATEVEIYVPGLPAWLLIPVGVALAWFVLAGVAGLVLVVRHSNRSSR
jgi:hypothetical protein